MVDFPEASFRGIFHPSLLSKDRPEVELDSGVPSFSSVAEAEAYQVKLSKTSSNPQWDKMNYERRGDARKRTREGLPSDAAASYVNKLTKKVLYAPPRSCHAITTLMSAFQIETVLKQKLLAVGLVAARPNDANDQETEPNELKRRVVDSRLALPHHAVRNSMSSVNTLRYMFFHMRCGVFVSIRNRRVVVFAPFVNSAFRNAWPAELFNVDLSEYYADKRDYYRKENIIPDLREWWANGNIICNEHTESLWGDNLLLPFKHMLETLCAERDVPDVDFFFNKRDYPQLKANPAKEPYDFCFDDPDARISPPRDVYLRNLAPILSFYSDPSEFSDVMIPTTEDWLGAVGQVLPSTSIPSALGQLKRPVDLYTSEQFHKFYVPWGKKVKIAFFRGNATGGGVDFKTNQRLRLAAINESWRGRDDRTFLDAGVTGFNMRDKKLLGSKMQFCKSFDLKLNPADFVPMFRQGTFKYILYVEGHCAANRYAFLMRLGSVVIKMRSHCRASEMWFFSSLKPLDWETVKNATNLDPAEVGDADHVLLDVSEEDMASYGSPGGDVVEKKLLDILEWCVRNDAACERVAKNAAEFYERELSRERILDYMQYVTTKIASVPVVDPSLIAQPMRSNDLTLFPEFALPKRRDLPCACRDDVDGRCLYCASELEGS